MYEHFFKLTAEPFRLSPDHRFCYNHTQYAKAKAYMAYAFMRAEGFVMVTGQPGTGKTTLIGDLVESLADENVAVANLVSTQLAADDLLRMVAFAFGLDAEVTEKSTILHQLSAKFLSLHRDGGRALLIVDEAQDLSPKAMEELRLLTNLQLDGKPLLQIFLLGQPELRDLVHAPGLEQVHQRIIATSNLRALREDETRAYVEHRLRVVGWNNDPAISLAVFPVIYRFSEGVPRRINLICSRLFLHTFVEQRHHIAIEDARTVVQELQEEQLSTHNFLNDEIFYAEDSYDDPMAEEDLTTATNLRAEGASVAHDEEPNLTLTSIEGNPSESTTDDGNAVNCKHSEMVGVDSDNDSGSVLPFGGEGRSTPLEMGWEAGDRFMANGNQPVPGELSENKQRSPQIVAASGSEGARNMVTLETCVTLFAALIAAGLVAIFVGFDRFL